MSILLYRRQTLRIVVHFASIASLLQMPQVADRVNERGADLDIWLYNKELHFSFQGLEEEG